MSLILDALNRARTEPEAGAVPSLESSHFTPGTPSRRGRWWWSGAALAGIVIVLLSWRLWREPNDLAAAEPVSGGAATEASVTPSAPPTAIVSQAAKGAPDAKVMTPASKPASATPVTPSEPPEAVAALYADAAAEAVSGSAEPESLGVSEAPVAPAAASEAPQATPPTTDPVVAVDEPPVDIEAVLRRAQQSLGNDALSPHPTPLLESLSQQTKDRIPTVIYSAHEFASDGTASVTLNGDRLTVGQRSGGFLVREILRDSVILQWGGNEFRLRSLNSWINL